MKTSALWAGRLLPPERSWYSFLLRPSLLQDHSTAVRINSIEKSMTPSGIKSVTIRLVAQSFKQLRYRVFHILICLCVQIWIRNCVWDRTTFNLFICTRPIGSEAGETQWLSIRHFKWIQLHINRPCHYFPWLWFLSLRSQQTFQWHDLLFINERSLPAQWRIQ